MDKNKSLISIIVAMSKNHVIGKNNQLPWHLPADLKHFKSITTDHAIIMGRKTFEAIGKPLPNRLNIILTRDYNFRAEGCVVVDSIDAAISEGLKFSQEIFIIGGAEIYKQTLPRVQKIYLTLVQIECEGDAFFPILSPNEWQEISREDFKADEKDAYDYSFIEYERY